MKKLFRLAAYAVFAVLFSFCKTQKKAMPLDLKMAVWAEIDSLEKQGLPKSALEKTEAILAKAKAENNWPEHVKALLFRAKYQIQLDEKGLIRAISDLRQEEKLATQPEKAVLQSLLGQLFQAYLDNQGWQIRQRTATENMPISDDIETWSAADFERTAQTFYVASISSPEVLSNTQLIDCESITTRSLGDTVDGQALRPTLFELLAHRTAAFLANPTNYLTQPVDAFLLNEKAVFAPAAEFANFDFGKKQEGSRLRLAVETYQKILQHHLAGKNRGALIDADLERLRFARYNSSVDGRDELFEKALGAMQKQHSKTIFEAEIAAERAEFFQNWTTEEDGKTTRFLKKSLDLADLVVDAYPQSIAAAKCRNIAKTIRSKSVNIVAEGQNAPNRAMLALVQLRNVETVFGRVLRFSRAEKEAYEQIQDQAERLVFVKKLPISTTFSQKIALPDDHEDHSTELSIRGQSVGEYAILIADNADFSAEKGGIVSVTPFSATNLAAVVHQVDEQISIIVADRMTGQPIKNATVRFFETNWDGQKQVKNQLGEAKTDENGIAKTQTSDGRGMECEVVLESDYLNVGGIYGQKRYENPPNRTAAIFCDRAIYRPGQLLFFKGILIEKDGKDAPKILPNQTVEAQLMDANGQVVAKKSLKSNAFGSVAGQFALPTTGLFGVFYLALIGENGLVGNANFRVEEYKRPRFEGKIQPVEGEFRLGETITATLEAANLAGSVLDGATVKWRVTRNRRYQIWWDYFKIAPNMGRPESEIAVGSGVTDAEGKFKISFPAIADESIAASEKPNFDFTIFADVTDATGESHGVTRTVSAGYASMELQIETSDSDALDSFKAITLRATNLNGQPVAAKGTIKITKINRPFFKNRIWQKPDLWTLPKYEYDKDFTSIAFRDEDDEKNWARQDFSWAKTWDADQPIDLAAAKLSGGFYEIIAETTDRNGQKVESKSYVDLVDYRAKKLPQPDAPLFIFLETKKAEPGSAVKIGFGSARKEARVFYTLERKNEVVEAKWQQLSAANEVTLTVDEADRGGIFMDFWTIQDGRFYHENRWIDVPFSNKELKIETSVFRDKLAPGAKEEWRLKISGPKKEKVAAEIVASMFDASLETFARNDWESRQAMAFVQNYGHVSVRNAGFEAAYPNGEWREFDFFEGQMQRIYPDLEWFGFPFYGNQVVMRSEMLMDASAPMPTSAPAPQSGRGKRMEKTNGSGGDEMKYDMDSAKSTGQVASSVAPPSSISESPNAPTPRKNLQELAFFQPDLMTDADGNVILKFTVPEALTRWKMMVFAHSKDLKTGFLTKEILTQKELMVLPNMPRFLREGDEIEVVGKVSNLSQNDLTGKARLELFDAISMQSLDSEWFMNGASTDFVAKKGQSAAVKFRLKVPMGHLEPIVWRMSATAGSFSDAEENALPVVTNRMLVTETMPMSVRGGQTKIFDFAAFKNSNSKTLLHQNFAVEFSPNPAWYAVQALPYLIEFPYECSEQIASRLFANALAAQVANSNPKIRAVFDRWKSQPEALASNLSKNQELKNALLEETPWVLESQNEEQQKRQIAVLFDLNRMASEQEKALAQLAERQQSDGGWAWFPGGRTDWWVTSHVLELVGKAQKLGALPADLYGKGFRVDDALHFCNARLTEYLTDLKKDKTFKSEANHLSPMIAQHLYQMHFYWPATDPDKQQDFESLRWARAQAKAFWTTQNLQTQAQIAIALNTFGEKETAKAILKSLRERAVVSEELGMYWPFDQGFYFYQMPIEAQTLLIEAFQTIENDQKSVENQRIWLLKNKQTTHWRTTTATAAAIYSLLIGQNSWLDDSKPLAIKMGGKTLSQKETQPEAGSGHFKKSFSRGEIKSDFGKIEVANPNSGPAFGAAFWQYFEDIDKVKSFKATPLTIDRKFFKIENGQNGPVLKDFSSLKIGDRVRVRIEIRSDRAMEFLHLKDTRASGLEPVDVLSQYRWQDGLGYYQSTRDLATHFFIDRLEKGAHVFEYELRVQQKGDFSSGVSTMECMYAPEFSSHAAGGRLRSE